MKLLSFMLARRSKHLFSGGNWKYTLGNGFLLITFAVYGWAAGLLYNSAAKGAIHLSPLLVYRAVGTILLLLPVLAKFFPTVTIKTGYFSPHFPLTKGQIVFLDLFFGILLKPLILVWAAMAACFLLTARLPAPADAIRLPLLLLLGVFLAENLVNALSWNKPRYLVLALASTAALAWLGVYRDLAGDTPVLLLGAGIAFLGIIYYGFYEVSPGAGSTHSGLRRLSGLPFGTFAKIGFGNRQYLLVIAVGMFFKTMIMWSYGYMMVRTKAATPSPVFIMALTPLILFTYVFNNIWGYFRSLAMTLSLTSGRLPDYLAGFTRLILPVLILDASISLIVLLALHRLTPAYIGIYACSCIFLFSLGVLSSFVRYIEIKKAFDLTRLKGNTSLMSSFAGIVVVIGFAYCYEQTLYLAIGFGVTVAATAAILVYVFRNSSLLIARFKAVLFTSPS